MRKFIAIIFSLMMMVLLSTTVTATNQIQSHNQDVGYSCVNQTFTPATINTFTLPATTGDITQYQRQIQGLTAIINESDTPQAKYQSLLIEKILILEAQLNAINTLISYQHPTQPGEITNNAIQTKATNQTNLQGPTRLDIGEINNPWILSEAELFLILPRSSRHGIGLINNPSCVKSSNSNATTPNRFDALFKEAHIAFNNRYNQ